MSLAKGSNVKVCRNFEKKTLPIFVTHTTPVSKTQEASARPASYIIREMKTRLQCKGYVCGWRARGTVLIAARACVRACVRAEQGV